MLANNLQNLVLVIISRNKGHVDGGNDLEEQTAGPKREPMV